MLHNGSIDNSQNLSVESRSRQRKLALGQKLLKEKERAIEEALTEKVKELDQGMADTLLKQALKLDVNEEIEK